MAPSRAALRPLSSLKASLRQCRFQRTQRRFQHDFIDVQATSVAVPLPSPTEEVIKHGLKEIPVFPPLPATWSNCKDPVQAIHDAQIAAFDPTGSRTRLFSRDNPESAKVGDILLVRQKNGDPYAGVCLNIRKRGIDTSILLRNQMTRVGVEMWYKVYSPNVTGIEVVQRKDKRARRNKLYYMRKPEHDIGSVENMVRQYLRQRAMLGASRTKGQDSVPSAKKKPKNNNKKSKARK